MPSQRLTQSRPNNIKSPPLSHPTQSAPGCTPHPAHTPRHQAFHSMPSNKFVPPLRQSARLNFPATCRISFVRQIPVAVAARTSAVDARVAKGSTCRAGPGGSLAGHARAAFPGSGCAAKPSSKPAGEAGKLDSPSTHAGKVFRTLRLRQSLANQRTPLASAALRPASPQALCFGDGGGCATAWMKPTTWWPTACRRAAPSAGRSRASAPRRQVRSPGRGHRLPPTARAARAEAKG